MRWRDFMGMVRRGIRKPPRVIFIRVLAVVRIQTERLRLPRRSAMSRKRLLYALRAASLDILQLGLPCFAEALPGWVVQIQLLCYSIPVAAVALDAECQEIDLLALGLVQSWGADS